MHDVAALAEQKEVTDVLRSALDSLPYREAHILRLRFGLDGHMPMTLEEIADVWSLTRERVRQIETNGLEHLRQPPRSALLKQFLS